MASGVYGYPAGYRRLAHSRWGCRSNTTGSLLCMSLHPELKSSPELKQAFDLLLVQERFEASSLGFETARLIGIEKSGGFITFYARSDPALLLVLCSRIGATRGDERVDELVENVLALQGAYGMWEYASHPGASRWVTFDILRALMSLDDEGEWTSMQPRTPFNPYPEIKKRF